MAIFTTADRDAIKSALITAATTGVAEVAISGQSVKSYSLAELKKLLDLILADLAAASGANTACGIRFRGTKPPAAG